MRGERPDQDEELTDEPVQPRQPQRRQGDDEEDATEDRRYRTQPAEVIDQPRVTPLVQHAYQQEEPAGRDAVADHLQAGALQARQAEREDAEDDEAEVSNAR